MTVGQYLASLAILAVVVVAALLLAVRRGSAMLAATATALLLTATACVWMGSLRGHGPGPARSMITALVAIAAATGVVYLRRHRFNSAGRFVTGALAWLVLVFAWIETAYLLRP